MIKKRYILFILLYVSAASLFGVEIEIPSKDPPAGVNSITVYRHNEDGSKYNKSAVRYNEYGNIVWKEVYDKKGDLKWKIEYTYDADDRYKILEETARAPDDSLAWRTKYSYGDSGRLSKKVTYNRHNQSEYTRVFDYNNGTVETLMYGPEGALRWRKKAVRLESGKTKRLYYYHPNGSRIKGIIREYNAAGRVEKETHIDEIGAVYRKFITEYDELGRVIGRRVLDHKDNVHRRVWIEYYKNGHIRRVRQVIPQDDRIEKQDYTYKTDQRGAWVRREKTVRIETDGREEPIVRHTVESREIDYFDYNTGDKE